MKIKDICIGDVFEVAVTTIPEHELKQKKEFIQVCGIYPTYINFDNGKYKFAVMKHDLVNGNKVTVRDTINSAKYIEFCA
jgi:hypothetical protein